MSSGIDAGSICRVAASPYPTYEIPGRVSGMRDVSLLSAERWLIEGAQLAGMQFVALCTQ